MSNYKQFECPNNLCRASNCFRHCKHCGVEVKWLNYLGDSYYETNKGKRVRLPYLNDDTVHRCTKIKPSYKKEPNEYVLDEYRTIVRIGGPVFKCLFCGVRGDLPVMKTHHTDDRFACSTKLTNYFFDAKPSRYIDTKNYRIDEY